MPTSRASTHSPVQDECAHNPLKQVDTLLELLSVEFDESIASPADLLGYIQALRAKLASREEAIVERDARLESLAAHSEELAMAQADAIVHSAEIIDELERTKKHLSAASSAAEEAAQDTQRLADTIFERTHDAVLVLHNRACTACNDNTLDLFDCQRTEILGKWPAVFSRAISEDGSPANSQLTEAYKQALDGCVCCTEVCLPRKNDSAYWAEVTMSSFTMKEAGHVLAIVRDVTARKELETELRRQRDFLNNIINAVPDQICVKDESRLVVAANAAFCNAHGVEPKDVKGKSTEWLESIEPSHLTEALEDQLLSTGRCRTAEHKFQWPDGSEGKVSVKRSLFHDRYGHRYMVATSRDITEDRAREERLRVLASVFKGASEGVAILTPDGRIREANPAFLNMTSSTDAPIGSLLANVLDFGDVEYATIVERISKGNSWSGKASGMDGQRSYWLSLSPSSEADSASARVIALVSDITELESTQTRLRHQAMYDTLTGLPNRRYFRDRLGRALDESRNSDDELTICFLDLDDFKHVNDSSGHSAGDRLLQVVARRIQYVLGDEAFVARFGGDEFAVIFPRSRYHDGEIDERINRLLLAFREPFQLDDSESVVGLSIGVTHSPHHATDADSLMCNADIAMYAAKGAGKNQVRVYESSMQANVDTRHRVQVKLRQAISQREISVCFQPKVEADSRKPAGCEALARWITPSGQAVSPAEFIPIAEQTGLILPLGSEVFRLAAEQACKWQAAGHLPSIGVNVSPHQLRSPRFIELTRATLRETGAHAEWFELEITENAMMEDVAHATKVINELANLGFRVAIDDFGTGYSSMSYLTKFNFHTLKIDLSFVRDVTHDQQSHAVVRSIISLGKGLGLNVIAEGVETPAQAAVLTEAGCTLLQGYYIGKPMSADHYWSWLNRQQALI